MAPKDGSDESVPTWDDVRKEAGALSREVAHQGLIWSRRALRVASHAASAAAKEAKKASKRAGTTVKKIRNQ